MAMRTDELVIAEMIGKNLPDLLYQICKLIPHSGTKSVLHIAARSLESLHANELTQAAVEWLAAMRTDTVEYEEADLVVTGEIDIETI